MAEDSQPLYIPHHFEPVMMRSALDVMLFLGPVLLGCEGDAGAGHPAHPTQNLYEFGTKCGGVVHSTLNDVKGACPHVHSLLDLAKVGQFDRYIQMLEDTTKRASNDWRPHYINARPHPRRYCVLHFAAEQGNRAAVEKLVELKADPLRLTRAVHSKEKPKAASDLARDRAACRDLEAFLEQQQSACLISWAVSWNRDVLLTQLEAQSKRDTDTGAVQRLVKIVPRMIQNRNWNLLHYAVNHDDSDIIKQLLVMQADPRHKGDAGGACDASSGDDSISTVTESPLEMAERRVRDGEGAPGTLELLLAYSRTPAVTASEAEGYSTKLVALLKKRNVDAFKKELGELKDPQAVLNTLPRGRRFAAIHHACWFKDHQLVEELLEKKADPCLKTADGMSTAQCATTRVKLGDTFFEDKTGLASTLQLKIDERHRHPLKPHTAAVQPQKSSHDTRWTRREFICIRELDATVFSQYYKLGSQLGKGAFGTVFKAKVSGTNISRAVKIIKRNNVSAKFKEVEMLQNLDHRNIVKVFEVFEDAETYTVVMQFAAGGDLRQALVYLSNKNYVTPYESRWLQQVVHGLLLALSYCHSLQPPVVHMDIKPENVLLLNSGAAMWQIPHPVLCDFGVTQRATEDIAGEKPVPKVSHISGTPGYMAPELWRGQKATTKADLFSLGAVIYYGQSGQHAFSHPGLTTGRPTEDMQEMHKLGPGSRVVGGSTKNPPDWECLFQARELAEHMLKVDPRERWSARDCLDSNWMKIFQSGDLQIDKLMEFSAFNPIVKLSLLTIAIVTPAEAVDVYPLFREADKTGRGVIELPEFIELMERKGICRDLAKRIFKGIDLSGANELCYTDVVAAYVASDREIIRRYLPVAFRFLSKGTSSLKQEQLLELLPEDGVAQCGPSDISPMPCIQELLEKCRGQDGVIGQDDFVQYVKTALAGAGLSTERRS